jgi:hypothetical protein
VLQGKVYAITGKAIALPKTTEVTMLLYTFVIIPFLVVI